MIEIILLSKKDPDSPISFLCCPGKIKSIYYPYMFFVIFSVLGFPLELIFGFVIGLLSIFYLETKISFSLLSRNHVEALQRSIFCACFEVFPNYVSIEEAEAEETPAFIFVQPGNNPVRPYERVDFI